MEAGEPQQFRVWGLGFKLGGSHHPGLGVVGGGSGGGFRCRVQGLGGVSKEGTGP